MEPLKVLITGAAGGLGSALAIRFSELEANLLLLDKDGRGLDALADEIHSRGYAEPGVCSLDLGVSGVAEFEQVAGILVSEYGGVDIIVHGAASFPGLQPIDQVTGENWSECIQVNLTSPWLLTMVCLPMLKQSVQGTVVFLHDGVDQTEAAYRGGYGVSKSGLRALGHIMASEFESGSVRVINFHPGPMRTDLRARAYLAEDPAGLADPSTVAKRLIGELEL